MTLPKSRLASHCYFSLLNLNNVNDPWLASIKDILNSSGQHNFNFFWESQNDLGAVDKKYVTKAQRQTLHTMKQQFLAAAVTKMAEENKLQFFRESKTKFIISNYLTILTNRKERSLFSKLRLGVLDLEIEVGRRGVGVPREERFCKLCNCGQVEDEAHFLFTCRSTEQNRQTSFIPLEQKLPEIAHVSHLDKLMYLYFNEELDSEELFLTSSFLSKIKNSRDAVLHPPQNLN